MNDDHPAAPSSAPPTVRTEIRRREAGRRPRRRRSSAPQLPLELEASASSTPTAAEPRRSSPKPGGCEPSRGPSTTTLGSVAEERAVEALQAAGYRIVARNFRCKLGELDVVAYDRGVLVFVEVRSRADDRHGHAAEMVTWKKRQRVTRVARAYLAFRRPRFHQCRFDVVAVTGDRIDIVRDAWRLGLL